MVRFEDTANVSGVIVGRLEDFDASRDTIFVEGNELNLNVAGYGVPASASYEVKIVRYDVQTPLSGSGAVADTNTAQQQWLLITTASGGHIFYALEGARIDMADLGATNGGSDEAHFIPVDEAATIDFTALEDVGFVDSVEVVPDGYEAKTNGYHINDFDFLASDVTTPIIGSDYGDVIAGG